MKTAFIHLLNASLLPAMHTEDYSWNRDQVDYCLQFCLLLFSSLPIGEKLGDLKHEESSTDIFSVEVESDFLQAFLNPFLYFNSSYEVETVIGKYANQHNIPRLTVMKQFDLLKRLMLKILILFCFWSDFIDYTPYLLMISPRDFYRCCYFRMEKGDESNPIVKKSSLQLSNENSSSFSKIPYHVLHEKIFFLLNTFYETTSNDDEKYNIFLKKFSFYNYCE
jgi:hypothetical protein